MLLKMRKKKENKNAVILDNCFETDKYFVIVIIIYLIIWQLEMAKMNLLILKKYMKY